MGTKFRGSEIKVMVDASAFLDDLRLYACRLGQCIDRGAFDASPELVWVYTSIESMVREIEDGYSSILRP